MAAKPLIVRPEDHESSLNAIGVSITVLADRDSTNGGEITFQKGPEGTGPPPHYHEWDESFYILEGEVDLNVEGKTETCGAGTLVHVPGGTVHGFSFGPGGGTMLEFTSFGSRVVGAFKQLDHELKPGPPDIARAIEIFKENGIDLPG